MFSDLHNFEGANRKWNAVYGTTIFNFGPSLDLGLTHSGASSNSKGKSATACSTLTSGREVDSSLLDSSMDIDLHLGHKKTRNVKNCNLNFGKPDTVKFNVDLDLSLSIRAVESDVTSLSLASSVVQLVDEGSTSSKWTGPLLHPIHGLHMDLNSYSSMTDPASSAPLENLTSIVTSRPNQRRKTSVKTCQFPGCTKGARGASGHCISHGGGQRCKRLGCNKGAEGKTAFCKAHGGGRRCEFLGCTKSAEGRTSLCIAHGGGRRCSYPEGCTRAARGKSDFCIHHGGGKRCKTDNCTKSAEGLSGLCIAHGGGRRCQYPECKKGAQGSTKYCKAHGGGKRCTFFGCNKGAEGSTLFCKAHGGGKRCSFEGGCTKSVHGGTLFCVAHGGGKRCAFPECTKSARGKTSFCVRHGGGKRCNHEGCTKSAQGSTDFCKAHGGGRRCLWGHPGSEFGAGAGGGAPCDKFARGKIGLCAAHSGQFHEYMVSKKGKEIATTQENVFSFGGNEDYSLSMHIPSNGDFSVPEGRVHGGGLMSMLRENLASFGANQAVGSPWEPVARNWV